MGINFDSDYERIWACNIIRFPIQHVSLMITLLVPLIVTSEIQLWNLYLYGTVQVSSGEFTGLSDSKCFKKSLPTIY